MALEKVGELRESGAIDCWIPGVPQPQGSAKAFVAGGRARVTTDNKKLYSWRREAIGYIKEQNTLPPMEGPVAVSADCFFRRPRSHFGARGLRPSAPVHKVTRPDVDKLGRGLLDAATMAGIYRDDSQVIELRIRKIYTHGADSEGIRLRVVSLGG